MDLLENLLIRYPNITHIRKNIQSAYEIMREFYRTKCKLLVAGNGGSAAGGKLKEFADVIIQVPESETYLIQELHLPIYHCLCAMLEYERFGE